MALAALVPLQYSGEPVILKSGIFTIGRALTNSFVLRDMSVSRCHCSLKYTGNKWTIQNKSVNKTFVNDQEIQDDTYFPLSNDDIVKLTYAVSFKFIFPYNETSFMGSSNKKRKIEKNYKTGENAAINIGGLQKNCESNRKTLFHTSQEPSTSTSKIDFLQDELNHVQYLKNQFIEENKELALKLIEKEADVMDKLSNNIKLEQEIIDLKANCATLEQEKEELQLQLTDYECQTTLLKLRLENLTELSMNQNCNRDSSQITEDEADKDILESVIKAEISEKEFSIKEKLQQTICLIRTIRPVKPVKSNKPDILQTITANLLELQSQIDELAIKRNEFEINIKSSNEIMLNQLNATNTEPFTQSKEEFKQVLQNQEDAISEMKEAFKADFLFNFYNSLEFDLQCSICHELFIKATCVDCGHIFCKKCIITWNRQNKSCPTCRKPIKTLLSCITLDSYIDQCYDLLFPDKKEIRDKLKQTHADDANTSDRSNVGPQLRAEPIVLSSDDNEDSDSSTSDITEFDSDFGDDELYYHRPRYGSCFICGDPEHWANSCPRRRRRR